MKIQIYNNIMKYVYDEIKITTNRTKNIKTKNHVWKSQLEDYKQAYAELQAANFVVEGNGCRLFDGLPLDEISQCESIICKRLNALHKK